MKKRCLIFFLILFHLSSVSFASSAINGDELTGNEKSNQLDNLILLCKIWGLLKYHHPEVMKGTYDWDQELINILPVYNSSINRAIRNQILLNWITKLGPVPDTQSIPDSLLTNAKLKPDYTWIKKSNLSSDLVNLLIKISNYHVKGDQRYVKFLSEDNVTIPSFINEDSYAQMHYPTVNYRLLAVYRYWNIIAYWYPYKYLLKQQWEDYLKVFINEAVAAKDEMAYLHLVQTMAGAIRDSHAAVNSKRVDDLTGIWVMPFTVKFIENKAVINSLNTKVIDVGIKPGNILESINDVKVSTIIESRRSYVSASNNAIVLREIARQLNRSQDSTSKVTIQDNNGRIQSYVLKNNIYSPYAISKVYDFAYQKDSSCFVLPGNILYINVGNFKTNQIALVKQQLKTVKGLILDARQYPKSGAGSVVTLLQNCLLPDKVAMSKFSSVVKGYPGLFKYTTPFVIGQNNADYYKGKVAILVNEETQSTSEFLTMAYQLVPKVIVVGSTTAGADGNVTYPFSLPGGYVTQITGLGVYYPDGRETQQLGIVADVEVKQTIEGYRSHKDDLLDKAVATVIQ